MNRNAAIAVIKDYLLREIAPDETPESVDLETHLITGGVIDSIGALQLVSFLEKEFQVEIPTYEVTAANLDTLDAIIRFVEKKRTTS